MGEGCVRAVQGNDTLKLATESTPPSNAINSQLKKYFEEASGMTVEIEVLPLEQVLQKMTLDIASQLGTYDLYYIDQSWAASVSQDVFDPREQIENKPDLAMPNYNIDDFLPALVDGIAKYEDRWSAAPWPDRTGPSDASRHSRRSSCHRSPPCRPAPRRFLQPSSALGRKPG